MPSRPHLVDATLFFSPTSGGVRRYLLAKHAWLGANAHARHSLLVPGPRDAGRAGGIVEFRAPRFPGSAGYRCPWRLGALARRIAQLAEYETTGDIAGRGVDVAAGPAGEA